jgi:shikimate kinase
MANQHDDANEQMQSNVVAKDNQQSNVITIKEQVEQSFVIFIPPIVQH